jgi:hypothetical protein
LPKHAARAWKALAGSVEEPPQLERPRLLTFLVTWIVELFVQAGDLDEIAAVCKDEPAAVAGWFTA